VIELQIQIALIVTIGALIFFAMRAVRERRASTDGRTISAGTQNRLLISGGAVIAVAIGVAILWPSFT
jgi:heme/copper-type cytochrome/quinol oxidase subunit 2